MKKKLFAILMSAMMLVTFMPVASFAAVNEKSAQAITDAGIRTVLKFTEEVGAESYMNTYLDEVKSGKYGIKSTADVKKIVDEKLDYVIVDTMGDDWFAGRHIPGAIATFAPLTKDLAGFTDAQWKAELKKVETAVGTKKVTKWYNKKTKKWTTTKPAKKYCGKSKKVSVVNKDKKIVVYCGFMGCSRSHTMAAKLVANGYKNVYRYAGGICAWVDAGYDVEGTDAE